LEQARTEHGNSTSHTSYITHPSFRITHQEARAPGAPDDGSSKLGRVFEVFFLRFDFLDGALYLIDCSTDDLWHVHGIGMDIYGSIRLEGYLL